MNTQTKPLEPAIPHVHVEPPPWFLHAQTYEKAGVMEIPGPENHPTILSFYAYTTLKGSKMAQTELTPWCSAFVCAVMEQSGIKSTKSAAARSWLGWGENIDQPRIGCIVVSERGDPLNPSAAHVAFYAGHMTDGGYLSLGGNQSNRVCTKAKPYSEVIGYRWPIEAK